VLSYTSDQQITFSKPIVRVIGLMETVADFAVKLLTPLQTSKKCSKLFSALCSFTGSDP